MKTQCLSFRHTLESHTLCMRSIYIIKVNLRSSAGLIHNQREDSILNLAYTTLHSTELLRRVTVQAFLVSFELSIRGCNDNKWKMKLNCD